MRVNKLIWIIGIMVVMNMAAVQAFGFDFNIFGYKVSWNQPKNVQVIDAIEEGTVNNFKTHKFDTYIVLANNDKKVQLFLKELDYERIGFVNTDDGQSYTIFVNMDGTISEIWNGLHDEQVIVKGSITRMGHLFNAGKQDEIKDVMNIPFKMRMKILIMRWF